MSSENYYISNQNEVHYLTFTIQEWIDVFTRKEYKLDIVNTLNFYVENKKLTIYAWCLMSNHIHLVCRAENSLSDFIRDFKRYSNKIIIERIITEPESRRIWMLNLFSYACRYDRRTKHYSLWQSTNHPIELNSNELIDQKIKYIHHNPIKAMIVANPEDYLFSSAVDYAGEKGLVKIELI